ncbi:MAG TPA: c-type cytochrome [Polyangiaceae bacterium]|nr:c-type cytochrome [Polyangiaceae bacterium]
MNRHVTNWIALLALGGAVSFGCSSGDDSSGQSNGGSGGAAGAAGHGGTAGSAGLANGGSSGASVSTGGGGGTKASAGSANGGSESGGEGGASDGSDALRARGALLVRSVALCGGCHTATGGTELAGNPQFKAGALPAPNLTPDKTGLGDWTDQQIMNAFRNGIDDQGRHLDPAMPYWLFHNMSDADAQAIVAFLRSLPPTSAVVGEANPDATPVTPLAPAALPASSLQPKDADYAAAVQGKYLLSGIAQCVRCHSPSNAGLPAPSFFSGVAPTSGTQIFSPNITPDATGISGWSAADVVTALKAGTNKAGVTLCGSMPSGSKGYGGLSDADAHAIGVYLTTIPAVKNASAAPSLEPACP